MKSKLILAAVLAVLPVAAVAGPSVGIGYADVGLSGHAGRPGVQISAGNLYGNQVIASGSAMFARGFYNVNANIGKLIQADGLGFEPYAGMGFVSMNYNQSEYGYNQPESIQDMYGLAGANVTMPLSRRVAFGLGGGFGHTLDTFSGANGAVYTGDAMANFNITHRVSTNLQVNYLRVPGQSVLAYGAGLSYHFS